ncbi:haloacid dehalogenase type II [soil metagenome]
MQIQPVQTRPGQIQALVFDVFGTVVDWRGSIVHEGKEWNHEQGGDVDWGAFADAWRAEYRPAMNRVRSGQLEWTDLDGLHALTLEQVADQFGLKLNPADTQRLHSVWHRLKPWPDSVEGLTRLRQKYVIATLSNGNVRLLVDMAKHAGLPWDCVLSAELARRYKPDPEVYLLAAELLSLPPERVMMVAAHADDLQAARALGLRTALVRRPLEHGPDGVAEEDPGADITADDLVDLADQLDV